MAGAAALGGVDSGVARESAGCRREQMEWGEAAGGRQQGAGDAIGARRSALCSEACGRRARVRWRTPGDEAGWQVEPALEGDEIDGAMHDR